ncbi:2-hydroxyacid dehydrogenase [Subdoligranulum variabile]|uniref:4-phosphoerythronate dehydrogenase n=1 Tax=Subdoligranulum variabile DSM 15176 TaxID=411471 RepID=D1PIB3_9FIRM|nr:2-hydroxyacid dehydrogenase [Subdoligranulum variabile]EFB77581.1 4-phosphoerythronate dehydrogenase [Subdoligranulum variabile DSM 15176]UWP67182.1 2-hydroxyacid dehydrogenase [Subdoligranulum variabile]
MSKIVILESLGISAEELAARKAPFEAQGHTFAEFARSTDPAVLADEAKDADALILANMPLPGAVIEGCDKLKFIDVAFTGVDHIGLDAARAKGITVSNASGYSNEAVAELVLGMALSLSRNLTAVEQRCRDGKTKDGLVGFELAGKTVGIVGLGKIGSRTAELFHALGCPILAHSRTVHADAPDYVRQVSLEDLLAQSDLVVLHCPLNDSTRGMINAEKLAMMKSTALLINVARGPVVVAGDLADALDQGVIAGAGIDVFDKEPPLDAGEPLLHCKNCLVTPHVAFATRESMTLRAEIVFDNLAAWLAGHPKNVVL